jgi:hypothetical protein
MQTRGYRGSGLRFALWWLGHPAPAASPLPFVVEVLDAARKAPAQWAAEALMRLGSTAHSPELDGSSEVHDLSAADVMATSMESGAAALAAEMVAGLHATLDPGHALATAVLGQFTAAWMASVFRVPVADVGMYEADAAESARLIREYVLPDGLNPSPAFEQGARAVVAKMYAPDWLDQLSAAIATAPAESFCAARDLLRGDPQLQAWRRSIHSFTSSFGRRASARSLTRMGPLAEPAIAVRAGMLGMFVGLGRMLTEMLSDVGGDSPS